MAELILIETDDTAHPRIYALKRELYAALKAMKPKDMTEREFELFVLLEREFEV